MDPDHCFWHNKRLAHALLLSGSFIDCEALAKRIVATLLCKQPKQVKQVKEPCTSCKSCNLVSQGEHPDLHWIKLKDDHAVIRVEQIRELQTYLYISPQLAENKVVLIQGAEKMNHSAANSLLKIVEEPPKQVYFILIAESIYTIPATILSRCQHWYFPNFTHYDGDYLAETKLVNQAECLIDDLLAIKKEKIAAVVIAEKWSVHQLSDLARLIYLIIAQMIHNYFHKTYPKSALFFKLDELIHYFRPTELYRLLDKLTLIIKNLSYSINLNQLLTLEDVLLSFQ